MRGVFSWGPNMISTLFLVKGEKFTYEMFVCDLLNLETNGFMNSLPRLMYL